MSARVQQAKLIPGVDEPVRPFLKWVGGKRQILPQLLAHRPKDYGVYHEPFLGGGALFFHLRPERAYLGDSNARLVRTYLGVRNDLEQVIEKLRVHEHKDSRAYYDRVRRKSVDHLTDADVAAWLIYLNKTGFNGLYRVNSKNVFNVPYGDNPGKTICDRKRLEACSHVLKSAQVSVEDFAAVLERAEKNDFVYFDPPYVPINETSKFTNYTAGGFGREEHERLAEVARALKKRRVHVLLSNSSAPLVRELYEKDFELIPVQATRMVNSKVSGRGAIEELLIVG